MRINFALVLSSSASCQRRAKSGRPHCLRAHPDQPSVEKHRKLLVAYLAMAEIGKGRTVAEVLIDAHAWKKRMAKQEP